MGKEGFIYSTEIIKGFNPVFEVTGCFVEHENKILLLHRQDHKAQGNTFGMPAGKLEEWETPEEATLREVQEETSLKIDKDELEFVTKLFVRYPTYDYIYYIFKHVLDDLHEVKTNPSEHKGHIWIEPERIDSIGYDLIPGLEECVGYGYGIWK